MLHLSPESQKNWAILGDRNTSFFHLSIIKRNRKNRIAFLHNQDGSHSTTQEQLAATLLDYFHFIYNVNNSNTNTNDIFSSNHVTDQGNCQLQPAISHPNSLAGSQNHMQMDLAFTNSVPDEAEIRNIIKEMRNNASSGPDGLNALFYKSS